jgi:hypothetical protein
MLHGSSSKDLLGIRAANTCGTQTRLLDHRLEYDPTMLCCHLNVMQIYVLGVPLGVFVGLCSRKALVVKSVKANEMSALQAQYKRSLAARDAAGRSRPSTCINTFERLFGGQQPEDRASGALEPILLDRREHEFQRSFGFLFAGYNDQAFW